MVHASLCDGPHFGVLMGFRSADKEKNAVFAASHHVASHCRFCG
jgi:hypothetical protein